MIPQTNSRNPPRRWWRRGTWRLGRCQRPNGCAPRAQLPAEELLSTLHSSAHETPTRSDGARPSPSSTGAGSCVHDEHVWTGVGCKSRGSTGSGVLSGGGPRSTAVANHHRWPRGLVDRGRSSTAAAASAGRRCSGSSAAAGREQATSSSIGSIGSAGGSKAAARAVQWHGNGINCSASAVAAAVDSG